MNQEIKKQWVAALRSGAYAKGRLQLRSRNPNCDTFCCLGVLCDLFLKNHPNADDEGFVGWEDFDKPGPVAFLRDDGGRNLYNLPGEVMLWAGLADDDPTITFGPIEVSLSTLNDEVMEYRTFSEIADLIEDNF